MGFSLKWVLAMGLLVMAYPAWAQDPVLLEVESNNEFAVVYADAIRLGPVRTGPYLIPADTRAIKLAAGLMQAWSVSPLLRDMEAAPGDTVRLQMDFPFHHRLDSRPFGARAYLDDGSARILLGTTPVVHVTRSPIPGAFAIELDGYEPVRITPRNEIWNRYDIALRALDPAAGSAQVLDIPRRRRTWIDYAASTIGIAAGIAAVHYKFKADRLDDTYRDTGDPALRPRIARFDDYSGVALGVMQINLGVLAIRFALR